MARAMLYNKNVARNLWREAVNTACRTINRVYFRPGTKGVFGLNLLLLKTEN